MVTAFAILAMFRIFLSFGLSQYFSVFFKNISLQYLHRRIWFFLSSTTKSSLKSNIFLCIAENISLLSWEYFSVDLGIFRCWVENISFLGWEYFCVQLRIFLCWVENISVLSWEYFCVGKWREEKCDWGIQAQPCLPPQWAPPSPSSTSPSLTSLTSSPSSPTHSWTIIACIVCFLGFNGCHALFHEMICVQMIPHLQIFDCMPRHVDFPICAIFNIPDINREIFSSNVPYLHFFDYMPRHCVLWTHELFVYCFVHQRSILHIRANVNCVNISICCPYIRSI